MTNGRVSVTLTAYELACAVEVGTQRSLRSLSRPNANFESRHNMWKEHIDGACAEMAVAKHFGVYWDASVDRYGSTYDVGKMQVRSSWSVPDLKVKPSDADWVYVVFAWGQAPTFDLCGWIVAGEAKRPEWYHDRGNGGAYAYWVPQSQLRPMRELTPAMVWRSSAV